MAEYQDVRTKFWNDLKVQAWPPHAKLLALFLLTNPQMNVLGLYQCTRKDAAFYTGLRGKRLEDAWQRLGQPPTDPFLEYDNTRGIVWIVKAFNYRLKSPKLISAAKSILHCHGSSPLAKKIKEYYTDTLSKTK